MCTPKEPHFFADDFPRNRYVDTLEDYLTLFESAGTCKSIGEASVWYLYSECALERIKEFRDDARIVVLLRNPVDLVVSMHSENLYNFNEDIDDFVAAYAAQGERRAGRTLPPDCRNPLMLQYTRLGRYHEWLTRVYSLFDADKVTVILLEELRANPRREYCRLLDFLGVADDGRVEFPRINVRKQYRVRRLGRFLQHPPERLRHWVTGLRRRTGIDLRRPALWLRGAISRPSAAGTIDVTTRTRLAADFDADISALETLLERPLGIWRP